MISWTGQGATMRGQGGSRYFRKDGRGWWSAWAPPLVLTAVLVAVSRFNYLLFHNLAELFASVVGILLCVVAWNTYTFSRNHFLMYLGTGFFWIASIDIVHALAYRGMNVLAITSANPATQFWLVARYGEALLLLTAPWFLDRPVRRIPTFAAFGLVAAISTFLVMTGNFPDAFVEGSGLTRFKIASEFVIVGLLVAAGGHLYYRRALVPPLVLRLTLASIAFTIVAEMAFVTYVDVYDLSLVGGHVCKLWAFWLVFLAIIRTTLTEPYLMMARGSSTYDAIPLPTVVVDHDGIVRHVNRAACDASGRKENDILGRPCHATFHPHELPADTCPICVRIRDGEAVTGLEVFYGNLEGWREFTLTPIDGPAGLRGMVQVSADITERKRTEQRLRHYQTDLERMVESRTSDLIEVNQEVQGFAYIVSHDLRTPLVSIKGFADELNRSLADARRRLGDVEPLLPEDHRQALRTDIGQDMAEDVHYIEAAAQQMEHLIDGIRELSRLGRRKIEIVSVDAAVVVDEVVKSLAYQIERRGVRVTVGDLPMVQADRLALQQVFANLLSNAVKYLDPDRKGEIAIEAERSGDATLFHVRDNGRGIAVRDLWHIFDLFRRGGNHDLPGDGLGLSYVRTLIRRMGGRIWCDSEVDRGSTFSFTLPDHPHDLLPARADEL